MWFDRRIVYRPSPIHGIGTFAIAPIQAGEPLIIVMGGLVYAPADYHAGIVAFAGAMYNEERLAENLCIATPLAFHYYINHSCAPNIVDRSQHPAATYYVALRAINTDEELTADYYTLADLAACACGSIHCRWRQAAE
jgi:SET domain-containing protein